MLQIDNIRVAYGQVQVIHGVSFEVNEGELVAIVGANGAGKTTILKTISGLLSPLEGQITFQGKEIGGIPPHQVIHHGLAMVAEGRRLFSKLSVRDNLYLGAYSIRDEQQISEEMDRMMDLFPRLRERLDNQAETLSGGEQQMLALARGLMPRPRLLMVDEMSLGLAPNLVTRVFDLLEEIKKTGITVLLVEQKVRETLEIADRTYVLQTGRIVQEGSGEELLESDQIKKAYLGL